MIRKFLAIFSFFAIFFITQSFGDITIKDDRYRWDILNEKIEIQQEVITLEDFFDSVEKKTGYRVVNKVDELDMKKRYVDLNKLNSLGSMFDAILDGYDAVVDVDDRKHRIEIIYPEHIYIDLPFGWNLLETKKELERKYPYIRFYIAGNRLSLYGLPQDLAKVTPYLRNYITNAYKKYSAFIKIYPYCTNVSANMFLGKRKYSGSEQYKPLKTIKTIIRHGDKVNVALGSLNVNFTVDTQNRVLIYDDVEIPFHKLNEVGFVFKLNSDLDDDPSWLKIFKHSRSDHYGENCNDVIITIDMSANSLIM